MPPGSSCHSPPQLRSAAASSRSAQAYASFPSPSSAPSCTVSLIRTGTKMAGHSSLLWKHSATLEQQTELKPTRILTDTGAYSDVMFGLFRHLGYRFCPRLADIGGTRFWRIDPRADYGKLNVVSQHRLKLQRIAPHWDDMLRLSGSLLLGRVPVTGIMRTLQVGDNPTRLALAIAEFGRIDKTLHSLRYIDDRDMRRV